MVTIATSSRAERRSGPSGSGEAIRLTALSACAGCAAKVGQAALREIVRGLHAPVDRRLLVSTDTADDAGVYRLDSRTALVQTIDFFTPIVDDPYDFGRIAATNALSDVYAMGGRPVTALNVVAMPVERVSGAAINRILRGGAAAAKAANCAVIGGHTIKTAEPIYGMAVTGIVHPKRLITNARARIGDLLVLTKPLGVGIVTTALKRGLIDGRDPLLRKAVRGMTTLNSVGAALAEARLVSAGTDVTGFGLTGHLSSLCRASEVGAEVSAATLPVLDPRVLRLIAEGCVPGGTRTNLENAAGAVEWGRVEEPLRVLMADAQTSGGLLLCVAPRRISVVVQMLRMHRTLAASVIGRIVRARRPGIVVT
ncbi:MAG TPA: selenide, water dikinase SelD [Phycisphaerae bacterium]|nr:selenide, water dikinase SelD [Phycisphaerae bacterium]